MNVLEKILEEIKKEKNSYEADHAWNYSKGLEYAKEIIRSHMGEVESDNWIPVSEGLPEVPEGTEDDDCPEFNVTIKGADKATTLKYAPDGTWFDDSGEVYNVIAWQPLPEAYKGGE